MKRSVSKSNFIEEISSLSHSIVFLYLHWSLRKAFLSLLAIVWNSPYKWMYLSFSPLPFASWSTGEGNRKPLQYFCLENPMKSTKKQKDKTLKDELPRLVGAQYATGEEWRNNSRKNEETEPKQKQHPAVDVTGDGSKVQSCKEKYCRGTWNVRSMNQGKL